MDRQGFGLERLIGLLLVLNLSVLAGGVFASYWLAREKPLASFNASKIQLLGDVLPGQADHPDAETSALPAEPTVKPAPALSTDAPAQVVAQMHEDRICRAWTTLDADGIAQVQAHMRQSGIADAAYEFKSGMPMGWWVYIPPMQNATALQVVIDDAQRKGVKDITPVRSGEFANALSLGAFPTLAAAREHAEEMMRRGLLSVKYGPRPGAGGIRLVAMQATPAMRRALASGWASGLEPKVCRDE